MLGKRVHSFPTKSLLCVAPSCGRIGRRDTAKELGTQEGQDGLETRQENDAWFSICMCLFGFPLLGP